MQQYDSDCSHGLKIPTRCQQPAVHSVKNINSSIMLLGGTMKQAHSPHASPSLHWLGFKIHFSFKKSPPCLNVSFGFVQCAIFNYCLSHHWTKRLFCLL